MLVGPARETRADRDAPSGASAARSGETPDSPAVCPTGAGTDLSGEEPSPRWSTLHPRTRSPHCCVAPWVGSARTRRTLGGAPGYRRDLGADRPERPVRCTTRDGWALDESRRKSTLHHP